MSTSSGPVWMMLGLVAFGTGALSSHEHSHWSTKAGVPVRHAEGTVHGFLELSTATGAPLAHGDLLQDVRDDGEVSSRMVFHFGEGSVFEETVTYTQRDVFTMHSYHLVESGPAFPDDLDATLSRSGEYVVHAKSHKDGSQKDYAGTLTIPTDVYNGMMSMIAKNVSSKEHTTVHLVAFMPAPRLIALEMVPSPADRVKLGGHREAAVDFALKPKLGFLLGLGARLTGKMPPDSHVWIVTDGVPAFVRSEGPLYTGLVRRIELANPSWPK